MKKQFVILLSLLSVALYGQRISVSYDPGFGFYQLKNLKDFQLEAIDNMNGLPVKALVKFPDYLNHSISIGLYKSRYEIVSLNFSFLTTGGRNHVRDYSGEYIMDIHLNGYEYGIAYDIIKPLNNNFFYNYGLRAGLSISDLAIEETLKISSMDDYQDSFDYVQSSLYMEPNLGVSYILFNNFLLKMSLGYNVNSALLFDNFIDWSGFRTRLGVCYRLNL